MGRRRTRRFADDDSAEEAPQAQAEPLGGGPSEEVVKKEEMRRDELVGLWRRQQPPVQYMYTRRHRQGRPPTAESPVEQRPEEAPAAESVERQRKEEEEVKGRGEVELDRRVETPPQTGRRGCGRPRKRRAPESPLEQQPEEAPAEESLKQRDEEEEAEAKGRDEEELERRVETPLQIDRRGWGRPRKKHRGPVSGKELAAESPLELQPEEAPAAESLKLREEEEEAKAKGREENEQGRRLEIPPLTRRRRMEEEALPTESLKKPKRQEAPPAPAGLVDKHQQQHQQMQQDDLAEHAVAVPIGKPVMVTGKRGKMQTKHYASFEHNGHIFELEDSVLITPETIREKPYAAIIKGITETEGSLTVTGQWFYRPEEAEIGEGTFCVARDTRELFYSFHIDDVPAESVMHKCIVHFIPKNKQIPARKKHPGFIVQKVYGAIEKKLWNLTDNEYEENRQQEINILVKKTMDRIGELPDLEPLRSKDVNTVDVISEPQAGKPEAPAISKPKNYAILARYNAVTGVETRDRWLDQLLESIPLAWSKEISARNIRADPVVSSKSASNLSCVKVSASEGNYKSYGFKDVVPIIASLEKSAYEALGSDSGKYNQKMTLLWYNIKNSTKLRRRLMEKELAPQVLLTMSPAELKAGLTSAEKTSELEQPRQLKMIDVRCQRCQEKKVRISDIVQAGHRDRYQLECTSCGHTWFSSYNGISSLAADGPCNTTVTGNAAAQLSAVEKKQQQAKTKSH